MKLEIEKCDVFGYNLGITRSDGTFCTLHHARTQDEAHRVFRSLTAFLGNLTREMIDWAPTTVPSSGIVRDGGATAR